MKQEKMYGIDLNSDDDEDYSPEEKEESQHEEKRELKTNIDIKQYYQEMKLIDLYQPTPCTKTAQQIVKEIIEEQQKHSIKRVKFAGKSFIINEKGEIVEEKQEKIQQQATPTNSQLTIKELRDSFVYFREVMVKLSSRARAINSITKSKLDWKQYKTKEQIEQQLEEKRKSGKGVLEKQRFLERANERVKKIKFK